MIARVASRWAAVVSAVLVAGCADSGPAESTTAALQSDSALPAPATAIAARVDTVARGLEVPWGVAVAPDGRIFVTERPGRIRVIDSSGLRPEPWATVDAFAVYRDWGPESGLMGIAIDPDFGTNRHIYVLVTEWRTTGDSAHRFSARAWRRLMTRVSPRRSLRFRNRIVRFVEEGGRGVRPVVVVDDLPANHYHAGGGLSFGPDGLLYASIGDVLIPGLAADRRVEAGKLLRFNKDGSIPADNPDPSSAVWASGLRNTQAFTWLGDGTLFAVEHGPTGMKQEMARAGHDELNVIRRGADYGWPAVIGRDTTMGSERPVWTWVTGIAPAGLARISARDSGRTAEFLVTGLRRRAERLVVSRSDEDGWRAIASDTLLGPEWGRLRTIVEAPDGTFLVTTSNRDARGLAGPDDDLVLRIRLGVR